MPYLRATSLGALSAVLLTAACSSGGSGGGETASPVSPPPPPPPPTPASMTDVIYGSGLTDNGSVNLLLDVYQPGGACTERRPFVLGIHGGGFVGGSRSTGSWVDNMDEVTARGFVGISIDYRLVGDEPLISAEFQPVLDAFEAAATAMGLDAGQLLQLEAAVAAFEDTVAALTWAADNAEAQCLDMERFALWGSSAGAVTALHVAYGLDEFFIDRPNPLVVVDYWGRLLLVDLLDAGDPPFLILHGTDDPTVSYDSAVSLASEANALSIPHSFYTVQDGPHGFSNVNPNRVLINGLPPREVTVDFIEAHLNGGTPIYETVTVPFDG